MNAEQIFKVVTKNIQTGIAYYKNPDPETLVSAEQIAKIWRDSIQVGMKHLYDELTKIYGQQSQPEEKEIAVNEEPKAVKSGPVPFKKDRRGRKATLTPEEKEARKKQQSLQAWENKKLHARLDATTECTTGKDFALFLKQNPKEVWYLYQTSQRFSAFRTALQEFFAWKPEEDPDGVDLLVKQCVRTMIAEPAAYGLSEKAAESGHVEFDEIKILDFKPVRGRRAYI